MDEGGGRVRVEVLVVAGMAVVEVGVGGGGFTLLKIARRNRQRC